MKATQKDFASLATRAARDARVFFFCGDDASAGDAAAKIHALLDDPGERIELAGSDLKKDPVRLGDEARSNSLFGGTRHIWVRAQGDEAHDAVEILIGSEAEPCPVLIVATGATDKSRTAKLLAGRTDALVAFFYPPDLGSVSGAVRAMAGAAGLRIDSDIAERIARGSGLDTRIARSEVEKLALYLDAAPESPKPVTSAALDAISAQTDGDDFGPVVDAVLGGKREAIGPELKRMRDQGMNPVGLLLAFERRTAQLAALSAKWGPGVDLGDLMKRERVFWKDQPAIMLQLRNWRGPKLERLAARLIGVHQSLMVNSQDSELILAQGLLAIAKNAASNAKRPTNRTA